MHNAQGENTMPANANLSQHDVDVLRDLAEKKAAAADSSVNTDRRNAWYAHDAGPGGRPMILAEYHGVHDENKPLPDSILQCEDDWARRIELALRAELYQFDVLKDDHVIEPWINVGWKVDFSDYGVQAVVHSGDRDGKMGARRWDPPIVDLDRDFEKLHFREFSVDRSSTGEVKERLEGIFEGILPVRIRGGFYWTMGLTWSAIDLIGLEGLMLYMYDNPKGLHRLMAFLRDDHLNLSSWLETEGLYSANNENDYIGSGSMGYTKELPAPDYVPGNPIREKDLWILCESQETVGVGPELFEEFIFPYQLSIVEKFGKCYYGCCEPVNNRWHILKRLPNLARVSVSPWADEEFMARELGTKYVYSRKPAPSLISTRNFDETEIRDDIRKTMSVAKGLRVEFLMKDVHTLNNEPQRLAGWVEIAREETE